MAAEVFLLPYSAVELAFLVAQGVVSILPISWLTPIRLATRFEKNLFCRHSPSIAALLKVVAIRVVE